MYRIMVALLCCIKQTMAEMEGVIEPSATCPCHSKPKDKAFVCVEKVLDDLPSCVSNDTRSLAVRVRGPSSKLLLSRLQQLDRLALSDLSTRELPADLFFKNPRLTAIILRECPRLERVPQEIFWLLSDLVEVSIFDSGLREVLNGTFRFSKSLKELSLYNNSFTRLDAELLDNTSLETISLENNPWHCDCSMSRFQKALELKGVSSIGNATCHTPEIFRDVLLTDIPQMLKCDHQ